MSGSQITCPNCGAKSAESAALCYDCGGDLRAAPGSALPSAKAAEFTGTRPKTVERVPIEPPDTEYIWEFVPFAPRLKAGLFSVENAAAVSEQLKAVVSDYQSRGWEYVRMEQVDVTVAPGCLASLFGGSSSTVPYDIIVFRGKRAV